MVILNEKLRDCFISIYLVIRVFYYMYLFFNLCVCKLIIIYNSCSIVFSKI